MKMLLILFPAVILTLCFIFGFLNTKRACVTFLCGAAASYALIIMAFVKLPEPVAVVYMLGGIVVMLITPLLTALAGVSAHKQVAVSPAEVAYSAYDNLDDAQKQKVKELAQKGLKFGAEFLGKHLQSKGHANAGGFFRRVSGAL